MHSFYYPNHQQHDPANLTATATSWLQTETAARGDAIHDAITAANLGPITAPGDFGSEPIGEIHDHGLLTTLQTAYSRMQQEDGRSPALPTTFLVGPRPERKPRAIDGLLGYYCTDANTPIFEHTWQTAYWAAQAALSAAALVAAGSEQLTYALTRPPGHHAGANFFGGFCYLNNAAIAAHWLVQQGNRVAILDLDYHHGNGTQEIFYGRSDVLFSSLHADPLMTYPYYWGYADEYGTGHGATFTYNYPLPRTTTMSRYQDTLHTALEKIQLFVPDVLVVSLGVDTHRDDPLGTFELDTPDFHTIGTAVAQTSIPLVVVQEGGYHLPTLGESVVAFLTGAQTGAPTPTP